MLTARGIELPSTRAARRTTSQKKTTTKRRSWVAIKRAKSGSEERRKAYREAKDAFALAERVREARERLGVTQAELATRIGNTQPAIARLEAGGNTPSFDTLRRIAAALGLELVVELRAAWRGLTGHRTNPRRCRSADQE